jgi:AbrB family looped-hinge helix DNA binding protein
MSTTKLSSKGQVVIPKSLRDARGWKAGTEFTIQATPLGLTLVPKKLFPETTLDQALEYFKDNYKGPPHTIDEMKAAIGREAVRRFKRSTPE